MLGFAVMYTNVQASHDPYIDFNEEEVEHRLTNMTCLVQPKFTNEVKGYLKGYTVRRRERAEHIIGRATIYFPMIEQFLKSKNMPDELKYLPVVESALRPDAISHAGAVGLWQFMEGTGKEYGLKINRTIDERYDPVKSTRSALRFLNRLYERFGSWELALASYNAGGGRVNRAVKRARSKNFWRVRRYLPRETRNYVPAFIAATYVMKYYDQHNMKPVYPNLDYQITELVLVYDKVSLWKVAQVTGLPIDVIRNLNPAYKKGYVPENKYGNFLVLPSRGMQAMKDYLRYRELDGALKQGFDERAFYQLEPDSDFNHPHYYKSIYTIQPGDQLSDLSQRFNCSPELIEAWNDLPQVAKLSPGKELIFYYPKAVIRYSPLFTQEYPDISVDISSVSLTSQNPSTVARDGYVIIEKRHRYYYLLRSMTLQEIAEKFDDISSDDLVLENSIDTHHPLQPGTRIRLGKK